MPIRMLPIPHFPDRITPQGGMQHGEIIATVKEIRGHEDIRGWRDDTDGTMCSNRISMQETTYNTLFATGNACLSTENMYLLELNYEVSV